MSCCGPFERVWGLNGDNIIIIPQEDFKFLPLFFRLISTLSQTMMNRSAGETEDASGDITAQEHTMIIQELQSILQTAEVTVVYKKQE